LRIKQLVLDLNVTIALDGKIIQGAKLHKIKEGDECAQKLELVRKIGQRGTVSIGNGSNDVLMLKESLLGVCILGREGTSGDAIMVADIIIADINDALDLLLNPDRLVDTLRK